MGSFLFYQVNKATHKYLIIALTDISLSHTTPIYLDYIMKNIVRYFLIDSKSKLNGIDIIEEKSAKHYNYYDKLFVFSDGITDNINSVTLSSIIKANNNSEVLREIALQAYRNQNRHDDITGCCYIKK